MTKLQDTINDACGSAEENELASWPCYLREEDPVELFNHGLQSARSMTLLSGLVAGAETAETLNRTQTGGTQSGGVRSATKMWLACNALTAADNNTITSYAITPFLNNEQATKRRMDAQIQDYECTGAAWSVGNSIGLGPCFDSQCTMESMYNDFIAVMKERDGRIARREPDAGFTGMYIEPARSDKMWGATNMVLTHGVPDENIYSGTGTNTATMTGTTGSVKFLPFVENWGQGECKPKLRVDATSNIFNNSEEGKDETQGNTMITQYVHGSRPGAWENDNTVDSTVSSTEDLVKAAQDKTQDKRPGAPAYGFVV